MAEEDDEKLDTSWVENFKAAELNYNHFYKEPLTTIKLYLLYVNKNKELIYRASVRCAMDENGGLKRERVIALIKHYQRHESITYKLTSLLRYNIDLNPEEINNFVNDPTAMSDQFLTVTKYLEDIHYAESIHMFHSLNALYFIYTENTGQTGQTRKITLASKTHKTMRNKKNLKIRKELN